MVVLPVAAALIAVVFGAHLLVRFTRRRALFEGSWAIALLMFALASGALGLGIVDEWSSMEYRTYWIFGAVLTVPYLALGEVYLLSRRRWVGHAALAVLLVATAWATAVTRTAPIVPGALEETFPLGRQVFGDGTTAHRLAQYFSWPTYIFLLVGVLWSAAQLRGRPELRSRFLGVVLVAVGATVVAAGSFVGAGFGRVVIFTTSLAVGVAAMYGGFLLASRPARAASAAAAGQVAPA